MSKMYSHQDACQPYRDKIAELEQELAVRDGNVPQTVYERNKELLEENARLKEQVRVLKIKNHSLREKIENMWDAHYIT